MTLKQLRRGFFKLISPTYKKIMQCNELITQQDKVMQDMIDKIDIIYKTIDISNINAATGILRVCQLAKIKALKDFDKICKENDIKYFLFYGTLLGAVRHKGFIPWDDDLDVVMERKHYIKFQNIFRDKEFNGYKYEFFSTIKPGCSFIKIFKYFGDFKLCMIDVFPLDFYNKALDEDEKVDLTNKIIELYQSGKIPNVIEHSKNPIYEGINDEIITKHQNILYESYKKYILNSQDMYVANPALVMFQFYWIERGTYNHIFDYEDIFPLKEMEFENYKFPVPNKPIFCLYRLYGDYMVAKKWNHGKLDLSYTKIKTLLDFIGQD